MRTIIYGEDLFLNGLGFPSSVEHGDTQPSSPDALAAGSAHSALEPRTVWQETGNRFIVEPGCSNIFPEMGGAALSGIVAGQSTVQPSAPKRDV